MGAVCHVDGVMWGRDRVVKVPAVRIALGTGNPWGGGAGAAGRLRTWIRR